MTARGGKRWSAAPLVQFGQRIGKNSGRVGKNQRRVGEGGKGSQRH